MHRKIYQNLTVDRRKLDRKMIEEKDFSSRKPVTPKYKDDRETSRKRYDKEK